MQLFANNITVFINQTVNSSNTSIILDDASKLPVLGIGDWFTITFYQSNSGVESNWEIVKVTAVVGNTLTAVRGFDGTTQREWVAGSVGQMRVTAYPLQQAITDSNNAVATANSADDKADSAIVTANSALDGLDLKADLTALAASTGSSLIGHIAAWTSSIATTVKNYLGFMPSHSYAFMTTAQIADVQAGTLTLDCTAAIQAFFNSCAHNGIKGTLGAGDYLVSSKLSITLGAKGFEILGCGSARFISSSTWAAATPVVHVIGASTNVGWRIGGFTVMPNVGGYGSATVGLKIGDETVSTIAINGYQYSTMQDVHVQGYPKLWQIAHARMIYFTNCAGWNQPAAFSHTCLDIICNGKFTGDLVFDTCQFVATHNTSATINKCISIVVNSGAYNNVNGNNSISGITFRSCDMYAGDRNIYIYAGAGSYISDIWFTAGCQIDQKSTNAVYVESNNAGSLIEDLHFEGFYCSASETGGMVFTSTGTFGAIKSVWINNSQVTDADSTAISFSGGGCTEIHVSDNVIRDCAATAGAISFNGVTGVICNNNKARQGLLARNPYYLIDFLAGTSIITANGNDGQQGINVSCIRDLSGDVVKNIRNNLNYNPIAPFNVTLTGSPFTWKNTTGSPVVASILGGTVSAINVNGWGFTPAAVMSIPVAQGQSLTITYTVAPTLNVFGT